MFLLAIFSVLLSFTSGRGGNETSIMICLSVSFLELEFTIYPIESS